MAEIVAVADFTPAVREPEDIAAPPARRKAHPGPDARDKWVSASVTDDIPAMIGRHSTRPTAATRSGSASASSSSTGTSSRSPPSRTTRRPAG